MNKYSLLTPPLNTGQGRRLEWSDLSISQAALAISNAAKEHSGPIIIVTPDNLTVNQLADNIHFFTDSSTSNIPIHIFPDWETLPYDQFSPHQDIISQRLKVLAQLPTLPSGIIITAISTIMHRLAPAGYIQSQSFSWQCGDHCDPIALRRQLEQVGYRSVSQVMEHGEFSIRGSIVDLFPMGSEQPIRIDLFDDEIDSIRYFDPDTQLSSKPIKKIELLAAREFPFDDTAITQFRQNWRAEFTGNPSQCAMYEDVSSGIAPAGIEYYLSLFFTTTNSFCNYLNDNSLIIRYGDLNTAADQFWQEIKHRHEQLSYDITRPIVPHQQCFLASSDIFGEFNQFSQIIINKHSKEKTKLFAIKTLSDLKINSKDERPLKTLENFLENYTDRILFCAESAGRREVLVELLNSIGIHPKPVEQWNDFYQNENKLGITHGFLNEGLQLTDPAITIITETELFGEQVQQRRLRKGRQIDPNVIIRNLTELQIGNPVVHIEHGIGRYLGLQTLEDSGIKADYITLEYADNARIYVPVTSLELISRYSGTSIDNVALNRLGSDKWSRAKRKAAEKIHDVATELLDIYAQRAAKKGFQYQTPDQHYYSFATNFPFEETPDQAEAIQQIINDMTSDKAIDRLVCGDVGFGKTEVAMRAAFLAVQSGKQVAVLVPTTLLANQHYQTFIDRFADFAVQIDYLSRFRTAQEQKIVLQKAAAGQIDIIIGTHKLLQKDIQFNNLGLLIIDEEHRFGVRQKERLKSLRTDVDILALTATPIPRTLNLSMAGVRDISIIATPPAKRLSIKTFVMERNNAVIREAIMREIMRGGQVFFLHNNIETITRIQQELSELIPEAKTNIAHGQMRERDLETVMSDFYHHRFNVLLCTTIIENGIDIPTANTIIIDRADKFGLAQLHQLRGRVGRSHHQAYAYLMTPHRKALTADAKKRLDAINSLGDLGIGFTLATHDLEIRGTGEILGEEQSGHMQAIGFSLYMELLERAVNALKSGKQPELSEPVHQAIEISLHISALIPEDYIPDIHLRLSFYKRLAIAEDKVTLQNIQAELIDRFGPLPESIRHLLKVTQLKQLARQIGITKIAANTKRINLDFISKPTIKPDSIINLIQNNPEQYRLQGPQRLQHLISTDNPQSRLATVENLLIKLSP